MKTLAVFPATHDIDALIKYRSMLRDYSLASICSFREDQDLLTKIEKNCGIFSTQSLDAIPKEVDALLLMDNIQGYLTDKYFQAIEQSKKKGIHVYASQKLYQQLQLDRESHPHVALLQNEYVPVNQYTTKHLFDISVPIIGVLGLGESCDKFEIQLLLQRVLDKLGYHAAFLSSNPLGALFGMHTLPPFLFNRAYTFQEKIIRFNHTVYDMCKTEQPDVVVLGLPSGIMPLGEYAYNFFSEIPLIISSAVAIDAGVLSVYFTEYIEDDYFDTLRDICERKFGIPIELFCMARQMIRYDNESRQFDYHFLTDQFIRKYGLDLTGSRAPVIRLTEQRSAENMIRFLVKGLEENLNAV